MGQTNKTGAGGKRTPAAIIQTSDTWLTTLINSIKAADKVRQINLFARITPGRKDYLDALAQRLGLSGSYLIDRLLTELRRQPSGPKGVPPWLEDAMVQYGKSDELSEESLPFCTRVSPENKQWLELMANRAGVSLSLLFEVIVWELENNDSETR